MEFKNLHQQDTPLLIANVWDVPSAKAAEKLNFQAIGTSSSSVAALLGYKDGEALSFSELEYIVGRIAGNTSLPLTVDLEAGYSRDPIEIAAHIKRLAKVGVVGINFEDSLVGEERSMRKAEDFAGTLSAVRAALEKEQIEMFINVRTDPFLLSHPQALAETKNRIPIYEEAGADGIFVPCITSESDIAAVVASTKLPINVMCMPELPDFETLARLGVKRISMGNFLFRNMYQHYAQSLGTVVQENAFTSIF